MSLLSSLCILTDSIFCSCVSPLVTPACLLLLCCHLLMVLKSSIPVTLFDMPSWTEICFPCTKYKMHNQSRKPTWKPCLFIISQVNDLKVSGTYYNCINLCRMFSIYRVTILSWLIKTTDMSCADADSCTSREGWYMVTVQNK